ncbi:MAG: NAD(P)/FAD-dependent oxidoreductase [Flavobacteriales bacterium]
MKLRSNEPYWLVRNGLIHDYPSLQHDLTVEVAIIGAGITGSLIAHRCMEEGRSTVVVDRREVAHGSTSATTGMLQYEIDVPLHALIERIGERDAVEAYRACERSIDQLASILRQVGEPAGFKKKASLYFAAYKKDVEFLRKEYTTRREHGFAVRWLTAEAIAERYGLQHTYGGILSRQGASIDAFRATHHLLHHNVQRGLHVFDRTALAKVVHRRNGATLTTEEGHTIRCEQVIHCTGFESTEILGDAHVELLSTYALVRETMCDRTSRLKDTLFWNTAHPYHYLRTTDDVRVLVGGADNDIVRGDRRDRALGKKALQLERQARKLLPDLDIRTDLTWAGTFGRTPDGLPCIGRHPKVPGAIFVLGFGGNGITFSVIGMDMVSALLAGREHPLAHAFRFGR